MRWIDYLELNADAYQSFQTDINARIEHHIQGLENGNYPIDLLRIHQGSIATLRQILLDLEDNKKESRADEYRTDQTRAGPR